MLFSVSNLGDPVNVGQPCFHVIYPPWISQFLRGFITPGRLRDLLFLLISLLLIVLHALLFLLFFKPERQTSRLYMWYLYIETTQNKPLIYSVSSSNLVISGHMAFHLRRIPCCSPCNCIPVWNELHIKPAFLVSLYGLIITSFFNYTQ